MHRQLSIIICTRNRPKELIRALKSIVYAVRQCQGDFEILLIDDGNYVPSLVDRIANILNCESITFRYVNKSDTPGLFLSRLKSLELAQFDIVLFLDDDVEIAPNYISQLFETYEIHPQAAGVGGIDVLVRPAPRWRQLWEVLIFYRSLDRGKLSVSGFGGSMDQWSTAVSPFPTEFLSGCNMSFRKNTLKDVVPKDWLQSYSLGEDLYLSFVARQSGILLCNPYMKVKHHRSRISRDNEEIVAYTQIVNHYKLLREYRAARWRYWALLWTAVGLAVFYFLGAIVRRSSWKRFRGAVKGLLYVCRQMSTGVMGKEV